MAFAKLLNNDGSEAAREEIPDLTDGDSEHPDIIVKEGRSFVKSDEDDNFVYYRSAMTLIIGA